MMKAEINGTPIKVDALTQITTRIWLEDTNYMITVNNETGKVRVFKKGEDKEVFNSEEL